jgi:amino acid adenylation domain-containing protein
MLVHELFRVQAQETPDDIAVVGASAVYTYDELDRRTNALAHRLQQAGVGPESLVGCWSHDAVTTVVQLLGVLKAGGAYLLVDPHLPLDRLRYVLEDSAPQCVLAAAPPPAALTAGRTVVSMADLDAAGTTVVPASTVGRDDLAYVAYTSGSTGRPKGVLITHAAVANHAVALRATFALRPGDRLPLMAPVAFDMATEEILPPLVSGCTLLDAPHHSPTMAEFTADVETSGYTILNVPAPLWHHWTTHLHATGTPLPSTLRLVIVGSDKIHTAKLDEWRALPGAERVQWVAAYGVTEATVTSLLYLTAHVDDLTGEPLVPIGTPIDNVTARAVRADGTPADDDEVGELYLGGVGVARGYQRLPERTAEHFVDGPESTRWYRTGDLVRRRPDGVFVWLGRHDAQIKINGLRIEPAEIEARILEHPTVAAAVVVCCGAGLDTAATLTAFVESRPGTEVDIEAVAAHLAANLHPLMVPRAIIVLDAIPLNANGKVDRKVLATKTSQAV